jgi:hypothetical protein
VNLAHWLDRVGRACPQAPAIAFGTVVASTTSGCAGAAPASPRRCVTGRGPSRATASRVWRRTIRRMWRRCSLRGGVGWRRSGHARLHPGEIEGQDGDFDLWSAPARAYAASGANRTFLGETADFDDPGSARHRRGCLFKTRPRYVERPACRPFVRPGPGCGATNPATRCLRCSSAELHCVSCRASTHVSP